MIADVTVACDAPNNIPGIDAIDADHHVLRIATADGAKTIGPVAIALDTAGINLDGLSLRSNTLDDAAAGFDYTAFQMPTAILLGVTGVSRAPSHP